MMRRSLDLAILIERSASLAQAVHRLSLFPRGAAAVSTWNGGYGAGVLSCPELVRLVAALQAADVAGMTVALARSDPRLIDVWSSRPCPSRPQAACAPRSGGSDHAAERVRGEHSRKRGPDPLGFSPAFAMVPRRSASRAICRHRGSAVLRHADLPSGGESRQAWLDITRLSEDTSYEPVWDTERAGGDYITWLQAGNER
jgi:hypothetical protein